jgi:glycosyltransferase involved in cell wall biosynthesis
MNPMRVLVVTCAHRGDDARIVQRQISAMLDAGFQVTLIAPEPLQTQVQQHVIIRRAIGRRRVSSWFDVLRNVAKYRKTVDLLLVHDLEIAALLSFMPGLPPRIFDVHEDLAQSVSDRSWIPFGFNSLVRKMVLFFERVITLRFKFILAEDSYQDERKRNLIIPNSTDIPKDCPPYKGSDRRIVYVGRISIGRGWNEILLIAEQLQGLAEVHLIGEADSDIRTAVQEAHDSGLLKWHGYLANSQALLLIEGALVGLSLLDNLPNYRHSLPTKIGEYFARGIPAIGSALPRTQELIEDAGAGWALQPPFVPQVVTIVQTLVNDPKLRVELGERCHAYAQKNLNWEIDSQRFLTYLKEVANGGLEKS